MNPVRIGGYDILAELGRGAMGVVYHAQDSAIGRPVAIKVIRIDPGTSKEEGAQLRQRLIREASAAGRLYHPGIVTVHQLGEDGQDVFIVMEYVEGASLDHLLCNNPVLDRAWAVDILAQVAVALDYAHKSNVVHRDVKPANILVRSDGRVKIADFGIAKITASATTGMTAAGTSLGSPSYMSPEQIHAAQIDGRSDQFALGTIAFQMLTGRMPFKGETAHTVMFQIVMADPFEAIPGDIPLSPEVRAVLARALAKKPTDRFPDCASFIRELSAAADVALPVSQTSTAKIESFPADPQQQQHDEIKKKESKSWLLFPILGALLTVLLVGGGVYWYSRVCCAPPPIPVPAPAPAPAIQPAPAPPAETPPVQTPPVQAKEETPAPVKKRPAAETVKSVKPAPTATTLLEAVTYGKVEQVKSLLASDANINQKDQDGSTPLMIASEGTAYLPNNLPLVQTLIAANANIEAQDSKGRTALDRAAAAGKPEVVRLLVDSGAMVNKQAHDGSTPLLHAVEFGKVPVLELLIARHAKVELADASGNTPLMIASEGNAYLPNNGPMVEALLAAGARVDALDKSGRSALYRASAEGKPEAVRLLLEHHANPNLRARDGSTPLIEAVTFAKPLAARLLMERGADVNLADARDTTPLMIAAEASPHIKVPAQYIKMLLEHGAKRDLKDSQGRTAYQRAVESKNKAAMELLK